MWYWSNDKLKLVNLTKFNTNSYKLLYIIKIITSFINGSSTVRVYYSYRYFNFTKRLKVFNVLKIENEQGPWVKYKKF